MDVIRAIDQYEYYHSRTGNSRAIWNIYRQQTAMLWHMVNYPRIAYKISVRVPEWINQKGD